MMAALAVIRLQGGMLVLRSQLWATNSVIVPADDACLVCDPSIFADEIEEIRTATHGYAHVYLLVTHSDFDHVCGVPAFAEATVIAGATTAASRHHALPGPSAPGSRQDGRPHCVIDRPSASRKCRASATARWRSTTRSLCAGEAFGVMPQRYRR
jgi:glyoxylase-like metal-dependent hydrolase (beta-lactamase superfamily II)